jgi:hypothetical protein
MKLKLVVLGLSLVLWTHAAAEPAQAIVIRHDVDDSEYAQGETAYPAVFDFFEQRGGVGTLIAPQWAVTVAHVAQDIPQDHRVSIAGETYKVQLVVLHPAWQSESFVDIGLVQLDRPVANATPIPLYERDDERGKIATLVGRGDTGTGVTGPTSRDHRLRAATNRVERVEGDILVFRFDAPTDENVTPLEGISGPGDSGGPAFIGLADSLHIAGLSVAQDSAGRERGTYGVWEFYTRVSPQVEWIQTTLQAAPEERQANSWGRLITFALVSLVLVSLVWWQRRRRTKELS